MGAGKASPGYDGSLRGGPVPLTSPESMSKPAAPGGQPLPEFVIAPAHPDNGSAEGAEIVFEVRQTSIGTDVLPVFSSVRHLVAALGTAQPWVALPLHTVREMAAAGGIGEVVLDPAIQPGVWHWRYADLEALEQDLAEHNLTSQGPASGESADAMRRQS